MLVDYSDSEEEGEETAAPTLPPAPLPAPIPASDPEPPKPPPRPARKVINLQALLARHDQQLPFEAASKVRPPCGVLSTYITSRPSHHVRRAMCTAC